MNPIDKFLQQPFDVAFTTAVTDLTHFLVNGSTSNQESASQVQEEVTNTQEEPVESIDQPALPQNSNEDLTIRLQTPQSILLAEQLRRETAPVVVEEEIIIVEDIKENESELVVVSDTANDEREEIVSSSEESTEEFFQLAVHTQVQPDVISIVDEEFLTDERIGGDDSEYSNEWIEEKDLETGNDEEIARQMGVSKDEDFAVVVEPKIAPKSLIIENFKKQSVVSPSHKKEKVPFDKKLHKAQKKKVKAEKKEKMKKDKAERKKKAAAEKKTIQQHKKNNKSHSHSHQHKNNK